MTAPRYAAFVSPHGFGHAARASAVMAALHRRNGAEFELVTTVHPWFFDESVDGIYRLHRVECDVGFRQRSALAQDLSETVKALDALVPFDDDLVADLADQLEQAGCVAALVDIAPFGVAVSERAGIPSVLVENFSWSWLYEPHFEQAPELRRPSAELAYWEAQATVHVQTEPLCLRDPKFELVPPISREPRRARAAVRDSLGIGASESVVLITMGGVDHALPFLERLKAVESVVFVVTGAERTTVDHNLRLFDNQTPLFMPDLMVAADAVVAKLGYGTVAEVWREGLPLAWVTRPDSAEMAPLEAFAERDLQGFLVQADEFLDGTWIDRVHALLAIPRRPRRGAGGAERVAEILEEVAVSRRP